MFLDLISALPIEHSRFTFIDIGTGKGLLLLLALQFPFERIIGVEACSRLAAVARENTASHDRIEVVCADAAVYERSHDKRVITYTIPSVIQHSVSFWLLQKARFALGRGRYIVYYSPACVNLLTDCGWLEKVTGTDDVFAIYRTRSLQTDIARG
jgi:hypothetical protein